MDMQKIKSGRMGEEGVRDLLFRLSYMGGEKETRHGLSPTKKGKNPVY